MIQVLDRLEFEPSLAHPVLGAVDLQLPVGDTNPVDEVGVICPCRLARLSGFLQQRQATALEGDIAIGVLSKQPSSVRSLFTNQVSSRPAMLSDHTLEERGVAHVNGGQVGVLLVRPWGVRWCARARCLILLHALQQLVAKFSSVYRSFRHFHAPSSVLLPVYVVWFLRQEPITDQLTGDRFGAEQCLDVGVKLSAA
ncbi:hypothetical protein HII36_49495 [Nonomuraea sp. NN258]|nr:hypothetical protein [Nonomuraea antri]NRQ39813.1 hypothetical protein [Nonomuraea antri]